MVGGVGEDIKMMEDYHMRQRGYSKASARESLTGAILFVDKIYDSSLSSSSLPVQRYSLRDSMDATNEEYRVTHELAESTHNFNAQFFESGLKNYN